MPAPTTTACRPRIALPATALPWQRDCGRGRGRGVRRSRLSALLATLLCLVGLCAGSLTGRAADGAGAAPASPVAPAAPSATSPASPAPAPAVEPPKAGPPTVKIVQYLEDGSRTSMYRNALPSLLSEIRSKTSINIDPDPVLISSFDDPVIFAHPFIYVNFADRKDWEFSDSEKTALRQYLERGGFIYVDAGISAEFLRASGAGQRHSFADWQAHPDLERAFASVIPGGTFRPLKRSHPMFSAFYKGLPDAHDLPDTIRNYVVTEKWPQGTYSAVGLSVNGRLAVLATPIVAMGWGRDPLGNWSTQIGFRVLETAPAMGDYLETAAYAGERYETRREDGGIDVLYCQEAAKPSWVKEPNGQWRVFRYYHGREMSEFAHTFFTQLGVNIVVYSLLQ